MDNRTEQLADGVWRVEVAPMVNAYVVAADGRSDAAGLTLVDTGTRRSGPRLVRSIRMLAFDPYRIDHVVLTHWHADHTGSAHRLAASGAAPVVHAGRGDLPAVRGEQRRPHAHVPVGEISAAGRLVGRFSSPGPPVPAAQPLDDGMALDFVAGAVVVATPGHTPGHIAIHLPDRGVVIAGDAVATVGRLTRGVPALRSARTLEAASLRRLAQLEFGVLAVGHGPPVVRDARRRLGRLADKVTDASRRAGGPRR